MTKTGKSRDRPLLRVGWSSLDLFSFSPTYEYKSYWSFFGVCCSAISLSILLLFVSITLKEFIERPPQLVTYGSIALSGVPDGNTFVPPPIAIGIYYSVQDTVSGNWTYTQVDYTNTDRYFRYTFTSKIMKEHDHFQRTVMTIPGVECSWSTTAAKNVICPNEEIRMDLSLDGSYNHNAFRYFEVGVERCSGTGCAPSEEIDALIDLGDVNVVLYTKEEDFDPILYHDNVQGGYIPSKPKRGVYENVQQWRFYPLPNREQLIDISMQIRSINVESPYFGSLQTCNTEIMTLHRVDSTYKSGGSRQIMNFYFKLHNRTTKEQVEYSIRSILHLLSYWGAMASFITIFTFSLIARWYNRRNFRVNWEKGNVNNSTSKHSPQDNSSPPKSCLFTDIRFLHQEDFDGRGKFKLSQEELYFPSNCYGELRAIALLEHDRKRKAANKIRDWYTGRRNGRNSTQKEKLKGIMKKKSTRNLPSATKTNSTVFSVSSLNSNTPTTTFQDTALLIVNVGEHQSQASQSTITSPVGIGENESISEISTKRPKDSASVSTSGGYSVISQTPCNINAIKQGIAENSKLLVQKAKHNRQLKPWTELTERLAQDAVISLFKPFVPCLDSSRMIKWKLNGDDIVQWLGLCDKNIHPVAFEGKVVCAHGQRPSVYAWAKYETCEAKYEKKTRILTLRFQTFLFGTGLPDELGNPQFTY